MNQKEYLYINTSDNKLQVFFAMLAYIEVYSDEYIYIYDEHNKQLLVECLKFIDFKMERKSGLSVEYQTVSIDINHSSPQTSISEQTVAPIVFPKIISDKFHLPFDKKINKIYFRGLLTKKRLIETMILFLNIIDLRAIFILCKNILKGRRDFIIDTKKIFINFSKRGRQIQFKYLDVDYYEEMSRYKYVFCPVGDFIWTYRFFEAIQVGSMPLSKHYTDSYASFHYLNRLPDFTKDFSEMTHKNISLLKEKFHLHKTSF